MKPTWIRTGPDEYYWPIKHIKVDMPEYGDDCFALFSNEAHAFEFLRARFHLSETQISEQERRFEF